MAKIISIFFLTLFISIILFFIFGNLFEGLGADILVVGTIIIILLAFLIAQMFYLIELVKKKKA